MRTVAARRDAAPGRRCASSLVTAHNVPPAIRLVIAHLQPASERIRVGLPALIARVPLARVTFNLRTMVARLRASFRAQLSALDTFAPPPAPSPAPRAPPTSMRAPASPAVLLRVSAPDARLLIRAHASVGVVVRDIVIARQLHPSDAVRAKFAQLEQLMTSLQASVQRGEPDAVAFAMRVNGVLRFDERWLDS